MTQGESHRANLLEALSAAEVKIVPSDFPNKGRFRVYTKSWGRDGWADEPQYPGQQPLRFPEEWTPLECFLAQRESAA